MNYDDSEEPVFNKNLVIPTILFGLLSPGILLTLPPESKGIWMTGLFPTLSSSQTKKNRFDVKSVCVCVCVSIGAKQALPIDCSLVDHFHAGEASPKSILVHTIVFGAALALIRTLWPSKKKSTTKSS